MVFNKISRRGIYLLAFILIFPSSVTFAQSGVVNAIGSGRDSSEAIAALLRSVVGKYLKDEAPNVTKSILQAEVVPNGSAFVQSYKILEGGRSGSTSIGANVDLDVLRSLIRFTPTQLEETSAKAIVVVRGARIPDGVVAGMKPVAPAKSNPYSVLETSAKDRFARRQFDVVSLTPEELKELPEGEDTASPEMLRGLGAKMGARVALGISSKYESFENENSHNLDQRIVVTATLVDVKRGLVLGKSSVNVNDPKSRKEQYLADLQRVLGEEGKDLFHDVFVSAGKRFLKTGDQQEFSIVRVESPQNAILVSKFRTLLESAKGVKSLTEHVIRRGAFDYALRPPVTPQQAAKILKSLTSEEFSIQTIENPLDGQGANSPVLIVRIVPKAPQSIEKPGEGDISVAPY